MMSDNNLILEMEHISKHFGGVWALEDVSFKLRKGEVHALIGENGAGKSTLIKILMGIHMADRGTVKLAGESVRISSPLKAAEAGISAVFQELAQIPTLSVSENVYLAHESTKAGGCLLDRRKMAEDTQRLLTEYGMNIRTSDKVGELTIAQAQMAEIIKCIAKKPKIIILDEPTSALTKFETEALFGIVRRMQRDGTSIIYISHRMDEIFEIADRITILRDGHNVCTIDDTKSATLDQIVKHMVGREMDLSNVKQSRDFSKAPVVLKAQNICQGKRFHNVGFELHKGEILGFAGLVGAGRSELMQIIFGVDKCDSGDVYLNGERLDALSPIHSVERGIALVPEERLTQGLILSHSIENNIVTPIFERLAKFGVVLRRRTAEVANEKIRELNIKTESKDKLASFLSGGNQQKVVLGKWLATEPQVFILDEPTAGIDVQSKAEIRTKIRELSDKGASIIFISSELPELIGISDRILVMNDNRIIAELFEPTQEDIMTTILKDRHDQSALEGIA